MDKNPLFKKLTEKYPHQKLDWSTDYIGQMKKNWMEKSSMDVDGSKFPIDVRWLTLNLVLKTKYSDPLHIFCADVIYGKKFLHDLRAILKSNHYFQNRLVQKIFEDSVTELFQELTKNTTRSWFNSALDTLLLIASLASVRRGALPIWHKNEVQSFVEKHFPKYSELAQELYSIKTNQEKRVEAITDLAKKEYTTVCLMEFSHHIKQIKPAIQKNSVHDEENYFKLVDDISNYL